MSLFNQKIKSYYFLKLLPALFLALSMIVPQGVFAQTSTVEQTYLVKFASGSDSQLLKNISTDARQMFVWTKDPEFLNIYSFRSALSLPELKQRLAEKFVYLEAEGRIRQAGVVLNDPGYTDNSLDIDRQWALSKSGFNTAWQTTVGSQRNIVAVIDTGIDQTHQDLKTINYITGYDFINNRSIAQQTNSDDNGHGTLVAGVLGATPNNSIGIAGTNWQISLMPIKALDAEGKGDAGTLAEAIVWATDNGAQFINLSVGGIGLGHDTTLSSAIAYAFNKNVVVVAAAGNDLKQVGDNLDVSPVYPICDDNNLNMIIGVAATDQNDLKADFSNYGKNCIDISAPGKRILSTINYDPVTKAAAKSAYAYASGTSLAVPFVVGQAALIKAAYPNLNNVQIRDRIIASAQKIDSLNLTQCGGSACAGLIGAGRISVAKSLEPNLIEIFSEGDLVRISDQPGLVYLVSGGQKRMVSTFVYNQKYLNAKFKTADLAHLDYLPQGAYATPMDGTLIKISGSPAVYMIQNGKKMPITLNIFKQRKLSFSQVNTVGFDEFNSWGLGSLLPPSDGAVVKSAKNKTVYWVVGQVLHPISQKYFNDRGLKIFPIVVLPDNEIKNFSKGDPYLG